MAVVRDNVRELRIGDMKIELEASLGSSVVYGNEFRGRLDKPYVGSLPDDMLAIYRRSQPTIERESEDGGTETVDNPDYVGYDIEAILRVAWAMARSVDPERGRPYEGGYESFRDEAIHQPAGVFEEAALFETVVMDLGGGVIFRRPEGPDGAGEPDEAQED